LAAITGHNLSLLHDALPVSTARLPTPSTKQVVERAYLTELFDDAQAEWRRDFAMAHLSYSPAHLVVYWSKIESACGKTDDSGPFYCPGDRTVYLDLKFFTLLVHTFGVRGVAQAYIVGHEIGHHVQRLLGIARLVDAANHADPHGANARSVKVELEADCLAGVWGRAAYRRAHLTTGDLNDAIKTADVIGDDYQADAAGYVDTSEWTHGSSRQRQYWLRTGFRSGKPVACDTFASH
jgi:predicted metalloprotease